MQLESNVALHVTPIIRDFNNPGLKHQDDDDLVVKPTQQRAGQQVHGPRMDQTGDNRVLDNTKATAINILVSHHRAHLKNCPWEIFLFFYFCKF